MNRLQKILGAKKNIEKGALSDFYLRGIPLSGGSTEQALASAYSKMELVYICISTTGRAISQVPLVVMEPNPDSPGGKRPVEEKNPWQQLVWNPNPYMDRYSFIEALSGFLQLDGEVFIVPFPPGTKHPKSLWVIRSKYMKVEKEKNTGHLLGWMYKPDQQGKSIFLSINEVARVYFWNPYDSYKGLSPIDAGKMSLTSDHQAALYNKKFFEEGAVPGGVLHTDQRLSQRTFDRVRGQFEERHKGVSNAHKVAVLEQGLKYTQTGLSHKDMEYLQLRKYSRQSILQVFGMKESVLSITADTNYATSREQTKMWWRGTNIPIMKLIESALNSVLISSNGFSFSFDVSNVEALHDTFSDKVDTGEKLFKMGFTAGEINNRLQLGFDERPWRDRWYIPINMVPVSEDGSMPLEQSDQYVAPELESVKALPGGVVYEIEEAFRGKLRRVFYDMRKKTLFLLEDGSPLNFEKEISDLEGFLSPLYKEAAEKGFFSVLPESVCPVEISGYLANKKLSSKKIIDVVRNQVYRKEKEARRIFNQINTRARDLARAEIQEAFNFGRALAEGEHYGKSD